MANLKIPRALDSKLVQMFSTLGELTGVSNGNVVLGGNVSIGMRDLTSPDSILLDVLQRKSYIIDHVSLACPGFNVYFYRGGQQDPKSWITDEVSLENNHSATAETERTKIEALMIISEILGSAYGTLEGTTQSASDALTAVHHSTLDRLELLNTELIQTTTELQSKLLDDARRKAEQNDAILLEKIEQNTTAFREKEQLLENEKDALRTREAELDNRGNTHARRELRSNMLEEVKARVAAFGVSSATVNKRKPVQLGILLLLITLMIFAGLAVSELLSFSSAKEILYRTNINQPQFSDAAGYTAYADNISKLASIRYPESHYYTILARITILTTLIGATLLFYIKWLNKWAQHHADQEFQLQRFQLDISRANWFIETCLEWKKETDSDIPTELIDKMTKGLFLPDQDNSGAVLHPADELASALFGSASKIKMKIGENEIEINPKKIPKQVPSNSENAE